MQHRTASSGGTMSTKEIGDGVTILTNDIIQSIYSIGSHLVQHGCSSGKLVKGTLFNNVLLRVYFHIYINQRALGPICVSYTHSNCDCTKCDLVRLTSYKGERTLAIPTTKFLLLHLRSVTEFTMTFQKSFATDAEYSALKNTYKW